jgi:hypothetical protein
MLWVITPIIYYSDLWDAKRFGIVSASLYLNNGSHFNISEVLTPDKLLDEKKYEAYGPLRMSTYFAVSYGLSFLSLTATISHVVLWYGKDIVQQVMGSGNLFKRDIHSKMMEIYPEVCNLIKFCNQLNW